MIIVGLSNSKSLAKKIAHKLNVDYEDLQTRKDNELHLRFHSNIKDQKVVLVQSLYPDTNHALFEVLYAASAARDLGAKEIVYVAPYLGFLREDIRDMEGECVNLHVLADLLNRNVDSLISVEPHLHQHSLAKNLFSIPFYKINATELFRDYVKKNFKDHKIIAVSERGKILAKHLDNNAELHEKIKRRGNVSVNLSFDYDGKKVVIFDDIIHTGKTMKETLRNLKAKEVNLMSVHGLFNNISLKDNVKDIITSNTVENKNSKIDVSGIIAGKLMEI